MSLLQAIYAPSELRASYRRLAPLLSLLRQYCPAGVRGRDQVSSRPLSSSFISSFHFLYFSLVFSCLSLFFLYCSLFLYFLLLLFGNGLSSFRLQEIEKSGGRTVASASKVVKISVKVCLH